MRLFLAVIVAGFGFWSGAAWAEDRSREIFVSGNGVARAAPDMAIIRIGVSREARTASQAMTEASAAAAAVLDNIKANGVEDRDVQTAAINLSPVWDHSNNRRPQVRGYVASNDLSVRVRELDNLGRLLDALVADGANTMNGLRFAIAETDGLETAARADAVKDARSKAETLAAAAGVTLGPVQEIREGGAVAAPQPMMRGAMMEADAAGVPVAAGELDIRVNVTVIFAISE